MKVINVIWDVFVCIVSLVLIILGCYMLIRWFTMSNLEAMQFDLAYELGGIEGFINMWRFDIHQAITTIL